MDFSKWLISNYPHYSMWLKYDDYPISTTLNVTNYFYNSRLISFELEFCYNGKKVAIISEQWRDSMQAVKMFKKRNFNWRILMLTKNKDTYVKKVIKKCKFLGFKNSRFLQTAINKFIAITSFKTADSLQLELQATSYSPIYYIWYI